ncbi:hypothetical protein [Streptobacillus moniliformis]|uniref:Uncharacterized protein n=2 Tax=Streptobacillus moniliformis TaxID=34105 RepID=D1AV79_STRM9|nr:hypothetical protein [Streptobacillus moniliformis]ACZ01639.1 conserved hypothetical protein [Streptobacillus moniliformis DSM 12112]AVL43361.1 hypothetical protein CEP89_05880 [Streptobacillus moniliformis]QXW66316.1 hypothetical protein KX935_03660 [Streptobacillus moniliformis]SQA13182.1 Uncharacterised protein [Streptobacillus moniliformis]
MKRNNKIKQLQQKLAKAVEVEKEKFVDTVKKLLDKYPIYTICSTSDIEKIFKYISENKDKNPIIIELLYEETKSKKEIEDKKEENINEVIEDINNFE